MLSIIIPSCEDPYLHKTIDSLLENLEGEFEIIPVLDGYKTKIKDDLRIKTIYLKQKIGMRGAINAGLEKAKGEFIMKVDSHCIFGKGFDKIMIENCQYNWLMIPRRYSLNELNWKRNKKKPVMDYHFLNFPKKSQYGYSMTPHPYKGLGCKDDIDDIMSFQGSCWFANKKYFMEHIGFLDDRIETYGNFVGEQLEIGLKYWLGGGKVKVNKKTWYAHLSKRKHHYDSGQYKRMYKKSRYTIANHTWTAKHWINNEEPNMIHKFDWLIKKFSPVPTWELNWKEIWKGYNL